MNRLPPRGPATALSPAAIQPMAHSQRRRLTLAALTATSILAIGVLGFPYQAHGSLSSGVTGIPAIQLASGPLYASGSRAKPTLTLTLSVEYPTVGAAYRDRNGESYSPTNTYIGYFHTGSCYRYNKTDNYFERYGNANASKGCDGKGFHGNFMNWANTSSIDILRLGLTGGDRITDDADKTILQRAVLRTGDYNESSTFPAKTLSAAHVKISVPDELKIKTDGSNHNGDIKIANCLDRIFFGTDSEGNCNDPKKNANLGLEKSERITQLKYNDDYLNTDGLQSCPQSSQCNFSGVRKVWYGHQEQDGRGRWTSKWNFAYVRNGIYCDWKNENMGDPWKDKRKTCYVSTETYDEEYPSTGLTRNNHFLTRVQVCESSSGTLADPRGTDYCQRYPNGNYKPVGNLQKYSDRVRVAAFGYLMQTGNLRYGGVLRAPMKFVGPKNYSPNGTELPGENTEVEWNIQTGVFIENPQKATEGNSGVINYLNKFGRTGTPGTYKSNDPVGELYYESLRYLQGLQPTPRAISANNTNDTSTPIPESFKDGFQVLTQWADPHADGVSTQDYSCVRNNILLIGDVNTHNDKSLPGNTRTTGEGDFDRSGEVDLSKNIPNFKTWTEVLAGFEKNSAVQYLDNKGVQRTTNSPNGRVFDMNANANTGSSDAAYYIAGAAYWANTHDIRGSAWTQNNKDAQGKSKVRPGMRVKTYVIDVNENTSNSDYNTRKQKQFFLTAKYGGFNDLSGYGNPFRDSSGNVDNSSWARTPASPTTSDPQTYFLANQAQDILDGLDDIFESIVAEANSIATGAISSSVLQQDDIGYLYRGQFDVSSWSGDVAALSLKTQGTGENTSLQLGTEQGWSAASKLASIAPSERNIVIGKPDRKSASRFLWNEIDTSLQIQLNASDSMGADRLAFLRGDRSKEGAPFRVRGRLLGDIVNSGVVYSGAPSNSVADTDYYTSALYTEKQDRAPVVFVGANDGMLHAFNATGESDGGKELFAYIPSWVTPRLHLLTDPNYSVNGHQSYVDATPVVAEAKVGTGEDATWKTVLVGGTGEGGQGVYALDVSDPSAFSKDKVLWEFTDADDADLGNVVGVPEILKVQTGANSYKWFAVVAGGVNNYVSDGRASSNGKPTLFFLDLGKAYGSNWSLGSNYFKIQFPVNTSINMASGMVNFTSSVNAYGVLERVYAGDLQGNLWRVDFKGKNLKDVGDVTGKPLFIATDKNSGGERQPISAKPILFRADSYNTVVAFGTGKYLEENDNTSTKQQTFYAVLDANTTPGGAEDDKDDSASGSVVARTRLKAADVNKATGDVTVANSTESPFNWATIYQIKANAKLTDPEQKKSHLYAGWYFHYIDNGERQISEGAVYGQQVLVNSLIPPSANQGICGTGDSFAYIVNVAMGTAEREASTVGLLGAPLVVDVDESYSALNSVGQRTRTIRSRVIQQGSKAGTEGTKVGEMISRTLLTGRLSWRQIPNYQELRDKPLENFAPGNP